MNKKDLKIMEDGYIVVPKFILKKINKLNISIEELIFILYIDNSNRKTLLNVEDFSNVLSYDKYKILELIDDLSNKHLIKIEVDKETKNEYILTNLFYDKLIDIMYNDKENNELSNNVFEIIEKEFGRTLSPMEYEIIKAWIDDGTEIEIIEEALKEAVFSGVNNLKYIDRIIYDWKKKNILTKEDVIKYKKQREDKNKKEDISKEINDDIADWNWFDED